MPMFHSNREVQGRHADVIVLNFELNLLQFISKQIEINSKDE